MVRDDPLEELVDDELLVPELELVDEDDDEELVLLLDEDEADDGGQK